MTPESVFLLIIAGFLGLTWGSFSNVLIYRVPRDLSLFWPPSACPHCGTPIRAWHNVPVLGWLWLRGRCAHCHTLIPMTYPAVEALTGILALIAAWVVLSGGYTGAWAPIAVAVWLAINIPAVFAVDFEHKLIPDTVSLGGIAVGFALAWAPGGIGWQASLMGIAVAGGGLWLFVALMGRLLRREAMGYGDIKLVAGFGALLGASHAVGAAILASFITLVCYWPLGRFLQRGEDPAEIPFGPFLQLGALLMALWGPQLLDWYLGLWF